MNEQIKKDIVSSSLVFGASYLALKGVELCVTVSSPFFGAVAYASFIYLNKQFLSNSLPYIQNQTVRQIIHIAAFVFFVFLATKFTAGALFGLILFTTACITSTVLLHRIIRAAVPLLNSKFGINLRPEDYIISGLIEFDTTRSTATAAAAAN
jgi:hypothetical protein